MDAADLCNGAVYRSKDWVAITFLVCLMLVIIASVAICNVRSLVAAWHSLRYVNDGDDPNGFRSCKCPACKGWER